MAATAPQKGRQVTATWPRMSLGVEMNNVVIKTAKWVNRLITKWTKIIGPGWARGRHNLQKWTLRGATPATSRKICSMLAANKSHTYLTITAWRPSAAAYDSASSPCQSPCSSSPSVSPRRFDTRPLWPPVSRAMVSLKISIKITFQNTYYVYFWLKYIIWFKLYKSLIDRLCLTEFQQKYFTINFIWLNLEKYLRKTCYLIETEINILPTFCLIEFRSNVWQWNWINYLIDNFVLSKYSNLFDRLILFDSKAIKHLIIYNCIKCSVDKIVLLDFQWNIWYSKLILENVLLSRTQEIRLKLKRVKMSVLQMK